MAGLNMTAFLTGGTRRLIDMRNAGEKTAAEIAKEDRLDEKKKEAESRAAIVAKNAAGMLASAKTTAATDLFDRSEKSIIDLEKRKVKAEDTAYQLGIKRKMDEWKRSNPGAPLDEQARYANSGQKPGEYAATLEIATSRKERNARKLVLDKAIKGGNATNLQKEERRAIGSASTYAQWLKDQEANKRIRITAGAKSLPRTSGEDTRAMNLALAQYHVANPMSYTLPTRSDGAPGRDQMVKLWDENGAKDHLIGIATQPVTARTSPNVKKSKREAQELIWRNNKMRMLALSFRTSDNSVPFLKNMQQAHAEYPKVIKKLSDDLNQKVYNAASKEDAKQIIDILLATGLIPPSGQIIDDVTRVYQAKFVLGKNKKPAEAKPSGITEPAPYPTPPPITPPKTDGTTGSAGDDTIGISPPAQSQPSEPTVPSATPDKASVIARIKTALAGLVGR